MTRCNSGNCIRPVLLITVLASLQLSGCGNNMSDLEQYAAEVRARKSTKIEPIPEIKEFPAFIYEEAGRRDPFAGLQFATPKESSVGGLQPDYTRPKEPLEEFPIDSLRMVGTLSTQGTLYALVRAGDGVVHRVTVGNHMGQNHGRIAGISEDTVELVEIIPDGFGGFMEQDAELTMRQE